MEVFTVSVGIGRVAISVRQTRQVVSRLHAVYVPRTWKASPSSSALYAVRARAVMSRCRGDYPPSAHICKGPSYLSFPVSQNLQSSTPPKRANSSGEDRTAYPPIRGPYLSLSDSSGPKRAGSQKDLRPRPFCRSCANYGQTPRTGELLQYKPGI